jgi:hypothetical protein
MTEEQVEIVCRVLEMLLGREKFNTKGKKEETCSLF